MLASPKGDFLLARRFAERQISPGNAGQSPTAGLWRALAVDRNPL
jgi:hypothetical protein